MCHSDENVIWEEPCETSGVCGVMSPHPNPLPAGEGGREDRLPMERVAALEFHHSGMCQRHNLVQTAAMVGFGHLGVAQIGTRDTGLGVRPGV